ncbi:MAG: histidine phosphatase family protein [Paracoccaceae bacterium]
MIALLRHFPTDWNGEGRIQGRIDRPLTAAARARLAALSLPPPWDGAAIVASPLARARDTAEALAQGRPVRLDPRLVELSYGTWQGRLSAELLADPASGFVPMDRWGWDRRPPGGERPSDGLARVRAALAEAAAEGPALLVLHRGLMRAILAAAHGWDYASPEPFEIKRGRLYPVEIAADGTPRAAHAPLRLIERGG